MAREIKSTTAWIIITAAVVILFGGALSWAYYVEPNDYDYSNGGTLVQQASDTKDETADWETYTNDEYGFSFKYSGNEFSVSTDRVSFWKNDIGKGKILIATGTESGGKILGLGADIDQVPADDIDKSILTGSSLSVPGLSDDKVVVKKIGNHNFIRIFPASAEGCFCYPLEYITKVNNIYISIQLFVKRDSIDSFDAKFSENKEVLLKEMYGNIESVVKTLKSTDFTTNWKTYSGQYENISLKYPSTWKLEETKGTPKDVATRVGWTGPFNGFTLTSSNNFVITYSTHIDGIGGGCNEGIDCPKVFYYNVSNLADANYSDLQLQQVEVREQDNKTVRFRVSGLWNPISEASIVPKTGDAIEGFFAVLYHDRGVDKTLSSLKGQFDENNRHNDLSTEDYFNLSDVVTAKQILQTVKFK